MCNASEYRPAIFTSMDDDGVGESLAGYPGYGNGYQASPAILADISSESLCLSHVRFCGAALAVQLYLGPDGNSTSTFSHSQFLNCTAGLAVMAYWGGSAGLALQNCLMAQVAYPVSLPESYCWLDCRNCTFDTAATLVSFYYADCDFYDSVFANIASLGADNLGGGINGFYYSPTFGDYPLDCGDAYPFQGAAGGYHYLTDACGFRGQGDCYASAPEIGDKTTYPPNVLLGAFSSSQTLSPQTQPDTGLSDLGYHYDVLDYVFNDFGVDADVTVNPGTVIATCGCGLQVGEGETLTFAGTVFAPCWVVHSTTVQGTPGAGRAVMMLPSDSLATRADLQDSTRALPGSQPRAALPRTCRLRPAIPELALPLSGLRSSTGASSGAVVHWCSV